MRDRILCAGGKIGRSNRGSVAVLVAVTITMLLGFVALGSDVVFALFKQREMEAAASSAALAGAVALAAGYPASYTTEVNAVATTAGYTNGTASVTIATNHPPRSGPNTANANAVEVIITQPQNLPLFGMFIKGPLKVSGRAVAVAGSSTKDCVLALNPANATGVLVNNGANVYLNSCGLAVNTNGTSALTVQGALLSANSVTIAGSDLVNNGGTLDSKIPVKTSQTAVTNPYAGVVVPTPTSCLTYTNKTQTLPVGTYCGGISTGNNAVVTLVTGGTYIIDGGSLNIGGAGGGGSFSGTNVTIVLTGSGTNYATVSISNGIPVTLSAITTGPTAGMLFFANPLGPTSNVSSIEGGSVVQLTGALYFPSQTVTYGNGSSAATTCTQLVAWEITFVGGATLNSNCTGIGTKTIGGAPSTLVE